MAHQVRQEEHGALQHTDQDEILACVVTGDIGGQFADPALEVCALLIKPERRKVELQTRYVGFEIPNRFAIGYGLDFDERYRNLPYVAALKE